MPWSDEEENTDEACLFCNELYIQLKKKKEWVQFSTSLEWAHEACVSVEAEGDTSVFIKNMFKFIIVFISRLFTQPKGIFEIFKRFTFYFCNNFFFH